ncbi:MAG: PLDc N-terminal domain-containing protein [Candidatus Pacebacteria bacterium]|nr:PLDc N-terminal domain-containing protein [Candidatus Paceibacterota bacterium]MDD5356521.1 PLDc N-terminal domain-containing protein [Candidatus Paceibacterota bacterium]
MKNIIQKLGFIIAVSFGALMPVLAQASAAVCKVNGKVVDCGNAGWLIGGIFGLGGIFMLILLAGTIFWIFMLIHAATHDIPNKPLWLLIIIFGHLLGAIVYYFSIKKNMSSSSKTPSSGASSTT